MTAMFFTKRELPAPGQALPGRSTPLSVVRTHHVNGQPIQAPGDVPAGHEVALFGLGCFWGAERLFWQVPGVFATSVGYAGGQTPNPTYEEVCSGGTGHAEVVRVVYDPAKISYGRLLKLFWEHHDPTQGMRQGNDIGTQYRSVIYTTSPRQQAEAEASRAQFQPALTAQGFGPVTTGIEPAPDYYFAETYHQQYLAKNPNGYCGLAGTGAVCPVGLGIEAAA